MTQRERLTECHRHLPAPVEKPFGYPVTDYKFERNLSEWADYIYDSIHRYHFGPNTGPLVVSGVFLSERAHFKEIQGFLKQVGWMTKLVTHTGEIILTIYHPDDPNRPT